MTEQEVETTEMQSCQRCGRELPVDLPPGVCPVCELTEAFSTREDLEGVTIDRYKVVEQIGSGGFATVYLAKQQKPVNRSVALKILKRDRVTECSVARFVLEQQTMATLNHPNIAKIFDAGETHKGTPYLVMELFEDCEPITHYCDRKRLTLGKRINIFADVCRGVHSAHQKGVIHRDLKPSNILIVESDGRPIPKIIDFGVAKPMETDDVAETENLRTGLRVGTPVYMPPEQARGASDVDTRADIYSLGVILYELISGAPPFPTSAFKNNEVTAMLDLIENEQPKQLLNRFDSMDDSVAKIAVKRNSAPGSLRREVQGDLNRIVMKSLEKQRELRYETALALLSDVESYLADQPLPSRKGTLLYRVGMCVRRNKKFLMIIAAVVLGLSAISLMIGHHMAQETRRSEGVDYLRKSDGFRETVARGCYHCSAH